jgi:hypothetical protein
VGGCARVHGEQTRRALSAAVQSEHDAFRAWLYWKGQVVRLVAVDAGKGGMC